LFHYRGKWANALAMMLRNGEDQRKKRFGRPETSLAEGKFSPDARKTRAIG
jgi:hypothetical protein